MGMLTIPSLILQALSSLSSLIIRKRNTWAISSYPLQKGVHQVQFNVMFSACTGINTRTVHLNSISVSCRHGLLCYSEPLISGAT